MSTKSVDVIVVGAGFAGIYAAINARDRGYGVLGLEAGSGYGGTWYWNRYPGARCDVESVDYSYSFDGELQSEWRWSERYSGHAEIRAYLEHVAKKYRLDDVFRFDQKVVSAVWNERDRNWELRTAREERFRARWLIMATGSLSEPLTPDYPGIEAFEGDILWTSRWPKDSPDLSGKRVGVIGTGSSGIQLIPEIAKDAAEVVVFQRTPNYTVPAFNRPIADDEWSRLQEEVEERRERSWDSPAGTPWADFSQSFYELSGADRVRHLEYAWTMGGVLFGVTFKEQRNDQHVNQYVRDFVENKIREIIDDSELLDALLPTYYPIGAKRLCTDTGYYEAYKRGNAKLVDLRKERIAEFLPKAIRTSQSTYTVDIVVFATGFDAMTGSLTSIDIRGADGVPLAEEWRDGYSSYLGLIAPGFPNMFTLNGPGSPSVFANMALTSENHAETVFELLDHMNKYGYSIVDVDEQLAEEWTSHCNSLVAGSVLTAIPSWYNGGNIGGKSDTFLAYTGGFKNYVNTTAALIESGFNGLDFT